MTTIPIAKNPENVRHEEMKRLERIVMDKKEDYSLLIEAILDGQNDGMVSVRHIREVARSFEVEVEDDNE